VLSRVCAFLSEGRIHAFQDNELVKPKEQSHVITSDGLYEEIWLAPNQWRREVSLGYYHATEVASQRGRKFQAFPDCELSRVLMRQRRFSIQSDLDIAQRLVLSELRKSHHAKQDKPAEPVYSRIRHMLFDDSCKGSPLRKLHHPPRLLRRSRPENPESIANDPHAIQLVNTSAPI